MRGLMDDVDFAGNKNKSEEKSEEEREYKRWLKRVELVKWSNVDYRRFIKFLQENKDYFKRENYDDRAKSEMRRVCQKTMMKNIWASSDGDAQLFNECFGRYSDCNPTYENTEKNYVWDNPDNMAFADRVIWYADSSYYNWWNFIHSDGFLKDLRDVGFPSDRWERIVQDVKMNNRQFFKGQKTYEPSDDGYYTMLSGMMI